MKKALITGVTGQDGSYLAHFLLQKGYQVHGIRRRVSGSNIERIEHLIDDTDSTTAPFQIHYGDLTDSSSVIGLINKIKPDEIYNLAAQSHVKVSFETPEYTANADALGPLRILEAMRLLDPDNKIKFYQASTSELFGNSFEATQAENTPFRPCSPYAAAKLYAYWITVNYREGYNMFASNGILFNHESPMRGTGFVTRKITEALSKVALGQLDHLKLGNLEAKRDWGHAKDYVEMQWLMMQQEEPSDYVIATGMSYSVREFVSEAAQYVGIKLRWSGTGVSEKGHIDAIDSDLFFQRTQTTHNFCQKDKLLVEVDPYYFRPNELFSLKGDASKARKELGWVPKTTFSELVAEMMEEDLRLVKQKMGQKTSAVQILGGEVGRQSDEQNEM